ncbi:MAG: MltA domain-containing protein [Hyphomonadaceae bacterium]|nr:MltA domain-containing protein [Hyphomonadaceae bacterium]
MRRVLTLLAATFLTACAGTSETRPGPTETQTPTAEFALRPARFEDIPDWTRVDLAPALMAFRRACDGRRLRDPGAALPGGGRYGGTVADWAPACSAAQNVAPGAERAFFEANFIPNMVSGGGEARVTAYYEPIIEARRLPDAVYSAPLMRKPGDMVTVDVAAFAEAYDNEALRGAPRALTGQLNGAQVLPYPKREDLGLAADQAFAWAHPVDVYNLQIQGSGRIAFPDGTQARASFAAQNGYRWRSALGALRDSGQLQGGATWQNFRAWSDRTGADATRQALNADPSYVFFQEERIDDPGAGPRGAAGVPLTPMGSIAVDPAFHPYGAVVFVDGEFDGQPFRHLFVAQDTGGAIRRGPLRGDVFFGSGPEAGRAAELMNSASPRWWTLTPRAAPIS